MRLYNLGPVAFRSLSLRQCTETDSLEFSDLAINFEEAQAFRAATLDHIRISLKLDCTAPGQDTYVTQRGSRGSILDHFTPVGRAIVEHCTLGKYVLHFSRWQSVHQNLIIRATQSSNAAA